MHICAMFFFLAHLLFRSVPSLKTGLRALSWSNLSIPFTSMSALRRSHGYPRRVGKYFRKASLISRLLPCLGLCLWYIYQRILNEIAVGANRADERDAFILYRYRSEEVVTEKGGTRSRARARRNGGELPAALHTRLDIFMAISPPRLYSDCRAASSLSTFARYWRQPLGYIWIGGKRRVAPFPTRMKNIVAESVSTGR